MTSPPEHWRVQTVSRLLTLQRTTMVNMAATREILMQHLWSRWRNWDEPLEYSVPWFCRRLVSSVVCAYCKLCGGCSWGLARLSLDVTGESEVLQRIVLVWGAGAGQGQTVDLAGQPMPALQVQRAVAPVLLPSGKAALMYGHVG